MRAAYECSEMSRGMGFALAVKIRETSLFSIRTRQPTEHVIETTVFHHHHYDVIDSAGLWRGQRLFLPGQPLRASRTHNRRGRNRSGCFA